MTVKEIVVKWLKDNGYDGLFECGECACKIEDIAPCGSFDAFINCHPGCLIEPYDSDTGWGIGRKKQGKPQTEVKS